MDIIDYKKGDKMAQQLKVAATYTTDFGTTKTGPAMYGVIASAFFNTKTDTAKITMELYESEASYLNGDDCYACVDKICSGDDWMTYFEGHKDLLVTYWDTEMTHVDAQTYIRGDWETIV